jgi:hypothetical protein
MVTFRVVFVVLCLSEFSFGSLSAQLPFCSFRSTSARHRGLLLGQRFADDVAFAVQADPSLPQLVKWAVVNQTTWEAIWDNQCRWFASYCEEVEGMIAGAQLGSAAARADPDFGLKLRLQNMETDLLLMLPWVSQAIRCSDVVSKHVLGHNEDDDTFFLGKCALVEDESDGWTAFFYPGQLAGNAYGWNWRSGVAVSSNQLSPNPLNVSGAGYYFLTRSALDAVSADDALARVTQYPAFSGFSLNVGSARDSRFFNVEVSVNKFKVTPAPVPHFNMYVYMNVSQQSDTSSVTRMERFDALGRPDDLEGIVVFLSDPHVFRSGRKICFCLNPLLSVSFFRRWCVDFVDCFV